MAFIERYQEGDTTVYNEIYQLEEEAFKPLFIGDVKLVLQETFRRVAFNLEVIYRELVKERYLFTQDAREDWRRPLVKPAKDTEELLSKLRSKVKGAGFVPLSLEYYYTIVGACNFGWDYEVNPEIPWEGADPIEIPPLKNLLEMMEEEGEEDRREIFLSPDYLHKDNISGDAYYLEITRKPAVDSLLLNSNWDIPFIQYLRVTLNNCGFSMADKCNYASLDAFCTRVRPMLKEI